MADDLCTGGNPLGISDEQMKAEGWPTDEELEEYLKLLPETPDPVTVDDFEVGRPLGRGKFGHVYLCREVVSKCPVAIKVLFKGQITKYRMEKQFAREIEIQNKLKHPNIVELYTFFHDEERIYMVLEFCVYGELYKELIKRGHFDEKDTCTIIGQIADALDYCHRNNVIHRDLKPENILLDEYDSNGGYQAKLGDFGWSIHSKHSRSTMCGTKDYLAPELINKQSYDSAVDNWCVGVLSYELLFGNTPFHAEKDKVTVDNIANVRYSFPSPYFSTGAKDLIASLLKQDPKKRLQLEKVVNHPWIQKHAINKPDQTWRSLTK